jgi:outer membrane murein-binding lipoprotein Lpp
MTNIGKKSLLVTAAVLIITLLGAVSVACAADAINVKAYPGVTIVYNGTTLTGASQPYIINSTTYVPLRMLMNNFGKNVVWDGTKQQVVISNSAAETAKDTQITNLQNKINTLESTITTLNAKIASLQKENDDDTSISEIRDALYDAFEDAGDEYFDDDGIDVSISLSGDEDDLAYTIKLDFDDADDYDDLRDTSESDIKSFLNAVKSEIEDQIEDTDYEDADITGKLVDYDTSSYYVKYNGSSYTFSWDSSDDDDDDDLTSIEEAVDDYFEDAGDDYLDDDGITCSITLSGDEDDLAYTIKLDFSNASDFDDLTDTTNSKIRSLMSAVKSKIVSEADGTDYEDASITVNWLIMTTQAIM